MLDFLLVLNFYVGTACKRASFSVQYFFSFKKFKTTIKLITVQHTNDTHQETNIKTGTEF